MLLCLGAALLFGLATPASKALLRDNRPVTLAGLLYIGGGLAMLPFVFRDAKKRGGTRIAPERRRKNIFRLTGAVIFGGCIGPVLLLWGISRAPAASCSLWLNLETVATLLVGWALFREHLGRSVVISSVIVVAAGALLVFPADAGTVTAALLVAGACAAWGLDNNFTAVIDGYSPAQITLVKGFVAGSVNFALGLWLEGGIPPTGFILPALVLGAASYGFSIQMYIAGAQHLGATKSQIFFASAPFFGMAVSWVFLGEGVLAVQIVAAILMVGALVLLFVSRHEHRHSHEAAEHTHSHVHDDGHHKHEHEDGLPLGTHTHLHEHGEIGHAHPHEPDIHHRHEHNG